MRTELRTVEAFQLGLKLSTRLKKDYNVMYLIKKKSKHNDSGFISRLIQVKITMAKNNNTNDHILPRKLSTSGGVMVSKLD